MFLDIQEGQAQYIGIDITVTTKLFQKVKMNHVLVDEPSREADVWKKILVTYPNSPWQSIIQQKIDSLREQ